MESSYPLITIGITAYEAQETIERAINAALAQSWTNTEILIVDDASSDHTVAVIKDVISGADNARLFIHENNKGVAAARNTLISGANGEFIAFFDDDDISDPSRLVKQYQRIIEYENDFGGPVICHAARTLHFRNGQERYEPTMGMDEDSTAPHGPDVALRILTGKPVKGAYGSLATCSQMARTQTYRDLGGFDVSFLRSEDTDFAVRLALAGGHFIGVAEPLVRQAMALTNDKTIVLEKKCALQLMEKHKAVIDQADSYDFCHRWLAAKYDYLAGHKAVFVRQILTLLFSHPVRTIKRLMLALPNRKHNKIIRQYHAKAKATP